MFIEKQHEENLKESVRKVPEWTKEVTKVT